MRLSSPTFDDQVGEPSQDDLAAFDSLDAQLSQSFPDPSHLRQSSCSAHSVTHELPVVDDENPFCSRTPQTERIHAPFTNASAIDSTIDYSRLANEPSDEELLDEAPPEVDYAAWFNSNPSNSFIGFSTAATAVTGFQRPSISGITTKTPFAPSAAALRDAEEKMRKWQEDVHLPDQVPTDKAPDSPHSTQLVSPPRATFSSARNVSFMHAPETPTPASFAKPTLTESHSSFRSLGGKRQTKPFKSPLITTTPSMLSHRQVSTPSISSPLRGYPSATALSRITTPVLPLRPSSVANHIMTQQPLGFTPRHGSITTRPKFVTPFKASVKFVTPGAFAVEKLPPTPTNPRTIVSRMYPPSVPSPRPCKRNSDERIFDLTPPPGRRTLAASGLRPQAYSAKQLEDMGINFKELSQVNPQTAPFYAFTTYSRSLPTSPDSSSSLPLDRSAMLEELHAKGCTLVEQTWVDNHWPLVLWKLAGMVALDPMSENDPFRKRWCWPEVVRQLMYRYERDLNSSSRPPLRLITTRDASAESPLVLCISNITWPASSSEGDIAPVQTYPELEITDGWYRLRARVDAPLARGVRKGKIKIGRKIAVAGAKLSAERKEGSEILEAYSSNVLLLTGNSTHMAPWHAKLGFQRGPFVATLNSLTADGGNVAVMMLTVIKAYPVAYIEFVEDTNGRKRREGPHDAKEESRLNMQWKTKRNSHASRLWSEYEKRRCKLLDCAERLEQRADGPPDKIYNIYDTLQEDTEAAKSIISSIGHEDAGWLARHIRERTVQERDEASREIEQELESTCPQRDVKAFCVMVVNDTRTHKYPSKRTAQITVWDVPGVSIPDGCTQSPFVPGQRYLVTNLVPTQASAWMDCSSGGEVYLSTRKNSKWTLIN
ncbi:hypothetical protein J3R82DRAFT_511, partial [Butyriboletus roseoflavus]